MKRVLLVIMMLTMFCCTGCQATQQYRPTKISVTGVVDEMPIEECGAVFNYTDDGYIVEYSDIGDWTTVASFVCNADGEVVRRELKDLEDQEPWHTEDIFYEWDKKNLVKKEIVDGEDGTKTEMYFDKFGNQTKKVHLSVGGDIENSYDYYYEYDFEGKVKSKTTKGTITYYFYDEENRLLREEYNGGDISATVYYIYSGNFLETKVEEWSNGEYVEKSYLYDEHGNVGAIWMRGMVDGADFRLDVTIDYAEVDKMGNGAIPSVEEWLEEVLGF